METQTVLCCSRGLKEIHLLLLFTKFASQQTELLNITVSYEERGGGEKKKRLDVCGERREEIKSFPTLSDNHYL